MPDEKTDRRVQRTRDLLKRALMQLVYEKGYDAVTIQDIVERANLGRTTFYSHYQSKDDLILDHYAEHAHGFVRRRFSRDDLLGETPSPEFERYLRSMADGKTIYLTITRAKDADVIMRAIRRLMTDNLRESLVAALPETAPSLPVDVLTNYIVGAQLALMDWWLTSRTPYAASDMARMLHQLQRAALRDAFGIAP
ncbi:MAG: TetR/AcrR family transcriptional regulator [Anaerolineae bacterium]|nr:TetR/AcrR family transcriptional regulator [Anaerolineae bacterium]